MARTVYTEKRGEPVLKKLLQVKGFSHTSVMHNSILQYWFDGTSIESLAVN